MAKFDSDNIDHITLFNRLCQKAQPHFGQHAYYSDCIRDVEFLTMLEQDGVVWWLIGETFTVMHRDCKILLDIKKGMDIKKGNSSARTLYRINRHTSQYGTVRYDITAWQNETE